MNIKQLLAELSGRLPELEWKLGNMGKVFSSKSLPKSLFRLGMGASSRAYVEEIKTDIQILGQRRDQSSALFLAGRIRQKINVLVALCQLDTTLEKPDTNINYNMDRLATRQQWLQSLTEEISILDQQLQALRSTHKKLIGQDPASQLNLQAELGRVEKRLTLAQETYKKATNL